MPNPYISIVSSVFNNEKNIELFYQRLIEVIKKITDSYEIIFVDDGSNDNSLLKITDFAKNNQNLKIIKLSRNFGHHKAIKCGLDNAKGEYIFLIDSDLDENPEWLIKLHQSIINTNYDVVYGYEKKRKGSFINKIFGSIWWRIVINTSNKQLHLNQITLRVMTKKYLENLKQFDEKDLVLGVLFAKSGFNQLGVEFKKENKSKTTYNFSKKLRLFLLPLFFETKFFIYSTFFLGIFFLIVSLLILIFILIQKFWLGDPVIGWASIVFSIWFVGSVLTFLCMVILIYLIKLKNINNFDPLYIIEKKINF